MPKYSAFFSKKIIVTKSTTYFLPPDDKNSFQSQILFFVNFPSNSKMDIYLDKKMSIFRSPKKLLDVFFCIFNPFET